MLVILPYPTRGRRTRVSLRAHLSATKVNIPFWQSLWAELIFFGRLQEGAVVANKSLNHLDWMAVRAGRGAIQI